MLTLQESPPQLTWGLSKYTSPPDRPLDEVDGGFAGVADELYHVAILE